MNSIYLLIGNFRKRRCRVAGHDYLDDLEAFHDLLTVFSQASGFGGTASFAQIIQAEQAGAPTHSMADLSHGIEVRFFHGLPQIVQLIMQPIQIAPLGLFRYF
jgi:hypothetical protein